MPKQIGGNNMLNLAVVGLGGIGVQHLRAINRLQSCKLGVVCDINEEVASKISREYGVPFCVDYKEIAEMKNIDAIIINLPHFLHCETTIFFLEHSFDVLIEKPMANTVEECEKMIAAARKNSRKLAVGHVQRFFGANIEVKRVVDDNSLGKLCMFSEIRTINYFDESRPKWFLNKKTSGGGIVMNYGAHALDKLFYLLGAEAVDVTATVGNFKNCTDIEGHAQFLLKFKNNISANVTFSGYGNCGYESVYYFTNGALKVTDTNNLWKNTDGIWEKADIDSNNEDAMALQLEEFCKYVNGEAANIATAEYGKNIVAAIEKIYNQNQQLKSANN